MYIMADFRYNLFYSSHLTVMDDRGKKNIHEVVSSNSFITGFLKMHTVILRFSGKAVNVFSVS